MFFSMFLRLQPRYTYGVDDFEVDRFLIRNYGRLSPVELSERTGLEAVVVAQRLERVLGERDFLGEEARVGVLLARLDGLVAEVEERLPGLSDRNLAPAVNAAAGAIGRVLRELRDLRERNQVDVVRVNGVYAGVLVQIVERAFERLVGRLEERFGVDGVELRGEFLELLEVVSGEFEDG
jgi:hypothetical protein